MKSKYGSKFLLRKILDDFKVDKDLPNIEYLETQIINLNALALNFKEQSENIEVTARARARARDLEQNCLGLINGIKFGISFMLHKNVNLMKAETIGEEVYGNNPD